MKMLLILILLVSHGFTVLAASPTGQELFSMPLGTNGKSCSSCHSKGEGLERVDSYDQEELRNVINTCIRQALKGDAFAADDPRLAKLEDFVRSVSK